MKQYLLPHLKFNTDRLYPPAFPDERIRDQKDVLGRSAQHLYRVHGYHLADLQGVVRRERVVCTGQDDDDPQGAGGLRS